MQHITEDGVGLQIADSAEKVLGFHGAARKAQRKGAAQAAIGAPTYTAPTAVPADSVEVTAPTTDEFNAALAALASTRTQLIALAADLATHKTLLNEIRAAIVEKGLIKGAA